MGIIWIASYPKSGNTWVRFLLANYLAGPITASAQTEEAVPGLDVRVDIRPKLARRNPLCMKTHYPWKADHPHAALSDKAVVVVRFPKDVLLSNLNYQRLIHGTDEGFSDADYARAFIGAGGDPIWLTRNGYGTLLDHISGWLDDPTAPPRLVVRYEDLARDAAGELTRVLTFLGFAVDPARVQRAAADSSFASMRALEEREKAHRVQGPVFPGAAPRNGWTRYFMNRGRSGASLAHLGAEIEARFDERFGGVMRRLGYDPKTGDWSDPSLRFAAPLPGVPGVNSGLSSPRSAGLSRSA